MTPLDASTMTLRTLATPARWRLTRDAEGAWLIPGFNGQIEAHCQGSGCTACPGPGPWLAAWTARPRIFAKLWALPGVVRWQTGDEEIRVLFPPARLPDVARVLRARRKRPVGPLQGFLKPAVAGLSRP
jgi:hypothetical protein